MKIRYNNEELHYLASTYQIYNFFQDWFVPSPALPIPPGGFGLNKEQIRETLNYFREYIL